MFVSFVNYTTSCATVSIVKQQTPQTCVLVMLGVIPLTKSSILLFARGKLHSDNMHFRFRFNQLVSKPTNYRRRGKFTDRMTASYRHVLFSKNYRQKRGLLQTFCEV